MSDVKLDDIRTRVSEDGTLWDDITLDVMDDRRELLHLYDALAAENAKLRETIAKAADTLADAARTFSVFGKNAAAGAMLIAEERTRAALQPSGERT